MGRGFDSEGIMKEIASLQQGLMMLIGTAFPRRCANCGRVYKTLEEFISKAKPLPRTHSLKAIPDEVGNPASELNRSCVCGSTVLELVQERRALTPEGRKRRKIFGELMETLMQLGWSENDARAALLKTMNGEKSERLVALLKMDFYEKIG